MFLFPKNNSNPEMKKKSMLKLSWTISNDTSVYLVLYKKNFIFEKKKNLLLHQPMI